MRKIFALIAIFALLLSSSSLASINTIAEPQNLSSFKQRLMQYHDSGQYYHDIATVVRRAIYYLRFRMTQNQRLQNPLKFAIVLDVDETCLSNYNDIRAMDFGRTHADVEEYISQGHDSAIPATRTLFNVAKANKVAIFLVTGRHERTRANTIKNLHDAGFNGWQQLYMKPNSYQRASIVPFKQNARRKIERQGYRIILNIGDQYSDLQGSHADMAFKLPNPFYAIG